MRNLDADAKFDLQTKSTCYNANNLASYNILVNQQRFFEEDLNSFPLYFDELSHLEPLVEEAVYFTEPLYKTTRFVLGARLSAVPEAFRNAITSGLMTSAINNPIVLQLNFGTALAAQRN